MHPYTNHGLYSSRMVMATKKVIIRLTLVINIPSLKLKTSAIMPINHGNNILDTVEFKNNMEEIAPEFCGYHSHPMVISSGMKAPVKSPDNPEVVISTTGEFINRPRVSITPPINPPHIISCLGVKRRDNREQVNLPSIMPIQKTERPRLDRKLEEPREVSIYMGSHVFIPY